MIQILHLTSQLPKGPAACIRKIGLLGALGARARGGGLLVIVILSYEELSISERASLSQEDCMKRSMKRILEKGPERRRTLRMIFNTLGPH
jgi:hypothetical protein